MRSFKLKRSAAALVVVGLLLLTGCSATSTDQAEKPVAPAEVAAAPIKIGTLATQDSLPLWVAEEKGYFTNAGLSSVEIVPFQSAMELQTAFGAGAINAMMTDIMVPANLSAAGTKVVLPMIMLGATTEQGRFAIVGAPGQKFESMNDLKGVPVGTASLTITEYVLDKLMEEAGVASADVKKEEVDKVPVRFQLLMSGKLKAASLPEPFVSLAEKTGAKIVPGGDDTKAKNNISQTVLAVNRTFTETDEGAASVAAVLAAWDMAVADINANSGEFRSTLVSKARLPEPLAADFVVSTYPTASAPTEEQVQVVLDWMKAKGYLKAEVVPADLLP